jgi:arsenate reductase (thioredoxin)
MSSTILFLCPHAAAKSIIASAYFNRLALEHGLDWIGDAAGTDPSPEIAPAVVNLLQNEGIDVSQQQPRRVRSDELENAYRVISMGCALEDLQMESDAVEQWLDVPAPSQDLIGAQKAIRQHVENLIEVLRSTR